MRKVCKLLLPNMFAVACMSALHADETVVEEDLALAYGDKTTVSIATGSKQTLRRAPAVATVITAEDITAMGAQDLDEVLETVPGMHVSRSPNSYTPIYVVRGIFSQQGPQTLMLLNGVPMTTVFTGNRGNIWGGMPVEHIARIEVIRGPGSALYGADAYSGVINIITKAAGSYSGTELGVRTGAFDSQDLWLQHGGQWGGVDIAAYLRLGSTDGYKEVITSDAQTRNDATFGTRASLAPGAVSTGRDAVDASLDIAYSKSRIRVAYKLRDKLGTGPGIASALDPTGNSRSQRFSMDYGWTDAQLTPNWGVGVNASYAHYSEVFNNLVLFPAGTRFPTGTFTNGMIGSPNRWDRQFRVSAFATYSGWQGHLWRFGMGHDDLNLYKTQEIKNFTFLPNGLPVPLGEMRDFSHTAPFMLPNRRRVNYVYAQDEWGLAKDWALTAGVRYDRYSDFGSTTNPRLALVWDVDYNLTAKLLYGQAFRAPAFNELYSINNPTVRGNPGLEPETIKTLEAAFAWQPSRQTHVNLTLFRSRLKDIIRTVPNSTPGTGATYFNIGSQKGHGFELETAWDVDSKLKLSAFYAHQRSTDGTTLQDAGNAPRKHAYARVDWKFFDGWQLGGQANHIADRKRVAGDTRPAVPDYTTLDLTLHKRMGEKGWTFSGSLRNAFDEDVREPSLAPGLIRYDLPMAGRAWYVQASYTM